MRPSSDGVGVTRPHRAHRLCAPCLGLHGLSVLEGIAIGIVGDGAVRAVVQQRKVHVGMVLILICRGARLACPHRWTDIGEQSL